MPLKEELEKSGNWLFRWRSYLPLAGLGLLLIGFREYRLPADDEFVDQLWEILCLSISFIGLGIRVFTIGYTPRHTSGRNTHQQKANVLNTTGMYSLVRHPLYLGNFFIWFGVSLFFHDWKLMLICVLLFWVYYERIMFAEEEFLRRKFGNLYEDWAKKTPPFIPKFSGWIQPSLPFSLRNVLKREYNGFFGIIFVFTFLEVVSNIVVYGKFEIDPMWRWIFGSGLLIYLVLRTLKKKTGILSVAGR